MEWQLHAIHSGVVPRPPPGQMPHRFQDRYDAGRQLGELLANSGYANRPEVLVLALPRGGVPVGYEVARTLHAPLDIFLVRKLGLPGHEELAIGALGSGGVRLLNEDIVHMYRVPPQEIERVATAELQELQRRTEAYRGARPFPDVTGRTVILVDDGLATGASMRVAVQALRREQPGRIVVAVPVGAAETCKALREEADDVVCAITPEPFYAVGLWYQDFEQTSDGEVSALLQQSLRDFAAETAAGGAERLRRP